MVSNPKQLKALLGNVLHLMHTALLGLLFFGLVASFAGSAHAHAFLPKDAQNERVTAPVVKTSGLGAQFAARHGMHPQKLEKSTNKTGPLTDISLSHGLTHTHDMPILGSAFVVSVAKAAKKLGNVMPHPSQVFDLQTDIFHPPRV